LPFKFKIQRIYSTCLLFNLCLLLLAVQHNQLQKVRSVKHLLKKYVKKCFIKKFKRSMQKKVNNDLKQTSPQQICELVSGGGASRPLRRMRARKNFAETLQSVEEFLVSGRAVQLVNCSFLTKTSF